MRTPLLLPALLIAGPLAVLGSVDRELLALVPAGTKSVAAIDVTDSQASPFGQHLLNRLNATDDQFQELKRQTGFDPTHDLQDILFAGFGSEDSQKQGSFAVLARGIFDTSRIKAAAKANHSTIRNYHDVEVVVNGAEDAHLTGLAFPSSDIAIFGDLPTVEAILDNGGAPPALDRRFEQEIERAGAKNNAWFVSHGGAASFVNHLSMDTREPVAQAKAFDSILLCSGGIRFGDSVEATFDAVTRSRQDAVSLADVVRFGASMVQMERQKDSRAAILGSALDKMNLQTSGETVHLSFSLPEKDLEQLADSGASQSGHGSH
ncbi:MAG: hypothetical protein M3Y24_09710 [Acidobacteriota bacterium]|nr:hypothetical protein [Acidobacteriota bacterium]